MKLNISAKQILLVLQVFSWIIFIGLCIETGGLIFNTIYALYKPIVAANFWNGADLSALYSFDKGYFITQTVLMIIASFMKALIFYVIIKLFYEKKFSLSDPFQPAITKLIFNIAYLCIGAGIFSQWAGKYAKWLMEKNIAMPAIDTLRVAGGDVWLFMAVVLFVIAQVFKKGIELQKENDLTV